MNARRQDEGATQSCIDRYYPWIATRCISSSFANNLIIFHLYPKQKTRSITHQHKIFPTPILNVHVTVFAPCLCCHRGQYDGAIRPLRQSCKFPRVVSPEFDLSTEQHCCRYHIIWQTCHHLLCRHQGGPAEIEMFCPDAKPYSKHGGGVHAVPCPVWTESRGLHECDAADQQALPIQQSLSIWWRQPCARLCQMVRCAF